MIRGGGPGTEAPGTVDAISLPTPAGTLSGTPSCATPADGTGTVDCLVVSQSPNGFTFQGVAFFPIRERRLTVAHSRWTLSTRVVRFAETAGTARCRP